jgi:hypothetical protein
MLANSQFIIYNQVSMSIPNIFHKIKGNTGIDKITILYLFIIVGVGIGSFGLGRISVKNGSNVDSGVTIIEGSTNAYKQEKNIDNTQISITQPISTTEKRYVASKNGKMYYSLGCGGAKRIKKENEVWFSTEQDALKSGYSKSSTCK